MSEPGAANDSITPPAPVRPLPMPALPAGPLPVAPLSPPLSASPARVQITFEYTFAELREGLTYSPENKPMSRTTKMSSLIGWVALVALATLLFLLLNTRATIGPTAPVLTPVPPNEPPARVEFAVAVMPSILAASVVAVIVLMGAAAVWILNARSERVRRSGRRISIVAGVAIGLLVSIGLIRFFNTPAEIGWTVSRGDALLLALAPWGLILIAVIALIVFLSRTHLRRMWESKPYLRRRRTVVFDELGEHASDEMTETLYRWPCFRRAWETTSVLVLQDENDLRHILPKRVMDPPTLDALRALIGRRVPECRFEVAPGGFPVASPPGR